MNDIDRAIAAAYDPENFRERGERVVARIAEHLTTMQTDLDSPVLPHRDPLELCEQFGTPFAKEGDADILGHLESILDSSHRLHHPHYVGHQVSAPLPLTSLSDLVAATLNNGMAVFEMGPAATAMERAVLRWMGEAAGWPQAEGHLTSGGSLGNLGAMITARQIMARLDAEGCPEVEKPALLVSEQAHYCAARAAHVMGWGKAGLQTVPVDERFKMRPEALGDALLASRKRGREPIAVFASSCSTATGSYDPLNAIADFCEEEKLWLHVDGAHGASALISERLRGKLEGIERADSLVWDAHKMLMMPALLTGVLFRNPEHASAAFAQKASYLFEGDPDEEWFNVGHRTLECTKTMMGMRLWLALRVQGTEFFRHYVERMHDLAQDFARTLEAASDFDLALQPESNIVCFRHRPSNTSDLDAHQKDLRRELVRSERFYITQTTLRGEHWLRVTLINPQTQASHLADLLDAIRARHFA